MGPMEDEQLEYLNPWQVVTYHHAIVLDYANNSDDPVMPNLNYKLQELVSAVETCRHHYYEGLFVKAAAILRSLAQNHPFYDGNKRTAFISMKSFLLLNGYFLSCSDDEALQTITDIVTRPEKRDLGLVASWIEQNSRTVEDLRSRPAMEMPVLMFAMNLMKTLVGAMDYATKQMPKLDAEKKSLLAEMIRDPDQHVPLDMPMRDQVVESIKQFQTVDITELMEMLEEKVNASVEDAQRLQLELLNGSTDNMPS